MRLPLLILHILGGTLGLLTGTVAMSVRKGGRLHRLSGNVFTVAMLTLAFSGLCLAILKSQSQQGNIIGSAVTFYLIGTAWLAGRRGNTSGDATGLIDWVAFFFGLAGAVGTLTYAVYTLRHPSSAEQSSPVGMSFFLGVVVMLATAGDLRVLIRRGIAPRQRIFRHVWRMCFGLFIATGSFFLGQQQVFPKFLRGSMLLTILALLPFPLMIYWLIRVRFGKAYKLQQTLHPISVAS